MALQVLVVEADASVSVAVARVFREARADVFSAASVEEAASVLSAVQLDAVVVDGDLPEALAGCVVEISRALQPETRCFLLVDHLDPADHAQPTCLSRVWFDELSAA